MLALNSATISNRYVVAAFPAAPTADEVVVGVLGINFYQQINGKFYPFNNNASNPLAIAYIAGSGLVGGGSGNVAYNTNLTGPNDNGQGVTLAASAGDGFGSDALTTGGSALANMDINVGGAGRLLITALEPAVGLGAARAQVALSYWLVAVVQAPAGRRYADLQAAFEVGAAWPPAPFSGGLRAAGLPRPARPGGRLILLFQLFTTPSL